MAKELVSGEYCYVGDPADKEKRIWLGCFNGLHLCVNKCYEDEFKNNEYYEAHPFDTCTPIEEVEYYYIWEKVDSGIISQSSYMTEECATRLSYQKEGWVRNDSTKRLPIT